MKSLQPIHSQKSAQRGITLIEALIALLILALGVLGLAAVQARMLVETRTTNSRATAIRLIADLGDRIRLNTGAVLGSGGDALAIVEPVSSSNSPYADPLGTTGFLPAAASEPTCTDTSFCTPAEQTSRDLWEWRTELATQLMNGRAKIDQVAGSQQLRVVVAWQLNENTNTTLSAATATPAQQALNQQLAAPLQITAADGTTDLCNSPGTNNYICHVDFIAY
jgi:type IV pilus assembly protein PilV